MIRLTLEQAATARAALLQGNFPPELQSAASELVDFLTIEINKQRKD